MYLHITVQFINLESVSHNKICRASNKGESRVKTNIIVFIQVSRVCSESIWNGTLQNPPQTEL